LAEPYYHRNLAERAVKEIKLRMALRLDYEGRYSPPIKSADRTETGIKLYFSGKSLRHWRSYIDNVVNSINMHGEKSYKSMNELFKSYFTQPHVNIPQDLSKFYKFQVQDKVYIDVPPPGRRDLSFKYTLNQGRLQAG